jgi:hypothetical protein
MAAAEERARASQVARVHADGELNMVAARSHSVLPAPAAITLGVGLCGTAGWLLVGPELRRRRARRIAPVRIQSRR